MTTVYLWNAHIKVFIGFYRKKKEEKIIPFTLLEGSYLDLPWPPRAEEGLRVHSDALRHVFHNTVLDNWRHTSTGRNCGPMPFMWNMQNPRGWLLSMFLIYWFFVSFNRFIIHIYRNCYENLILVNTSRNLNHKVTVESSKFTLLFYFCFIHLIFR